MSPGLARAPSGTPASGRHASLSGVPASGTYTAANPMLPPAGLTPQPKAHPTPPPLAPRSDFAAATVFAGGQPPLAKGGPNKTVALNPSGLTPAPTTNSGSLQLDAPPRRRLSVVIAFGVIGGMALGGGALAFLRQRGPDRPPPAPIEAGKPSPEPVVSPPPTVAPLANPAEVVPAVAIDAGAAEAKPAEPEAKPAEPEAKPAEPEAKPAERKTKTRKTRTKTDRTGSGTQEGGVDRGD
jgi:hypothetical protein